jgi:alpha-glucuronidase
MCSIAAARAAGCRAFASKVIASAATPTQSAVRAELQRGLTGLLGATPPLSEQIDSDGALVVGPFGLPISTQKR